MSSFSLHFHPLPYLNRLPVRDLSTIDLVVIHCTELPDLAMAREYGEKVLYESGTGNSGHYYIDRDGTTQVYAPPQHIAHHVRGYNERAIGIELVNTGRYPHWLASNHQHMHEAYPAPQIRSLLCLLDTLVQHLPSLTFIAGHEELDTAEVQASDDAGKKVPRKRDPGPLFPWSEIAAHCALQRWHNDINT